MTSQGISEDIKQQLAKKEAEKEQKEKKIEELVEERKKLETNLRKAKQEERPDLEASIVRIEKDVDSLRAQIPALNEQIRLLLGECDFFFSSFFFGEIRAVASTGAGGGGAPPRKFSAPVTSFNNFVYYIISFL